MDGFFSPPTRSFTATTFQLFYWNQSLTKSKMGQKESQKYFSSLEFLSMSIQLERKKWIFFVYLLLFLFRCVLRNKIVQISIWKAGAKVITASYPDCVFINISETCRIRVHGKVQAEKYVAQNSIQQCVRFWRKCSWSNIVSTVPNTHTTSQQCSLVCSLLLLHRIIIIYPRKSKFHYVAHSYIHSMAFVCFSFVGMYVRCAAALDCFFRSHSRSLSRSTSYIHTPRTYTQSAFYLYLCIFLCIFFSRSLMCFFFASAKFVYSALILLFLTSNNLFWLRLPLHFIFSPVAARIGRSCWWRSQIMAKYPKITLFHIISAVQANEPTTILRIYVYGS